MKDNVIQGLKFVFSILLIPVVIATTYAFRKELLTFPENYRAGFVSGILVCVLVHLFLVELKGFYSFGHRLVSGIFRFFAPLVNVAPLVIPVYTLLLLIFYYFATLFSKPSGNWPGVYMFLVSFTLSMHLIFTSRRLRETDGNAAKSNYLFSMTWIYVINLFIIAMLMDLAMAHFSFPRFFTSTTQATQWIYQTLGRQLF